MTSWRSVCGTWKFLDGQLYRKVNQNGKTDVWVCVSENPDNLSVILLKLLEEVLESRSG